jgi:hypothetical protein
MHEPDEQKNHLIIPWISTRPDIYIVTHSGFSISQWNFITLRVQYTTLDYSPQLFYSSNTRATSTGSLIQLLITTLRTHVQPLLVLWHHCVLSLHVPELNSLSSSSSLAQLSPSAPKALLYIAHSRFHSNVSVYIVVLLWKCHKLTVM